MAPPVGTPAPIINPINSLKCDRYELIIIEEGFSLGPVDPPAGEG